MRKFVGILAAIAVAVGIAIAGPGAMGASALSSGVAFSSANLSTWQTNGVVWSIGQSRGVVVAGGTFTQLTPPPGGSGAALGVSALALLDAETGAPTSCQIPVTLAGGTPTVRAVATSPDGKTVYIGGYFSKVGTKTVSRIAAIDPIACTVLPFTVKSITATVRAISVNASSVFFGGDFRSVDGQPRGSFASADPISGALQPWAPDADLSGRAIAISPDSTKVAIGGDFNRVNGQDSHSISIVDATAGAVVRAYPLGFISQTSVTKALLTSGNSLYAGNEGTGGGVFDGRFAIDWTTLDQRWRDTCLGATQSVLVYNDVLYSASHAHDCSSMNEFQDGKRNYFMAEGTQTPELKSWFPVGNDGINEGIGPRSLIVSHGSTTGKDFLWAGGEFTRINNQTQMGLTRFGTTDASVPPTPTVTAEALLPGQVQVRVRTVVDPDSSDLTYSIYRNGAATPIWTGTATSFWWTRPQITFVDSSVVAGTTYTYRVTANDGTNTTALSGGSSAKAIGAGGSAYAAGVIADGPSMFWRFDEASGTVVQDKSGQTTTGKNGQLQEGVALGATGAMPSDPSNKAATFDGVDDYAWNDQYQLAPSQFSIETWINTTTTQGGKIVGYGNGRPRSDNGNASLSANYDRQIYMDNAGHLIFGVYTGSPSYIQTSGTFNDGAWHQIVGTQGPAGMALYVDGVKVGTNGVTANQSYYGVWHVGGDNLNGWPSQPASMYFGGKIDDTSIYPGPLSAQSVASHYRLAGGTPNVNQAPADAYGAAVFNDDPDQFWRFNDSAAQAQDSSFSKTATGTYGSGAVHASDGIVADGADITTDGTQNGLIVADQSSSGPSTYSLELWFKTASTSGGKLIGFEDATSGNGSNYDKQIYMTPAGNLVYGVYIGYVASLQSAATYNDDKWHYVLATQSSAGMTLRVDGATVGTNTTSNSQSFTGHWRIGSGSVGGWPGSGSGSFVGSLDEVAVYGTALSAAQAQNHYALGRADNIAPTVPSGLSASAGSAGVSLSWNASTDNLGLKGYRLFRGTTAGFTADAASQIAEVADTSYVDEDLPAGTYFYRVAAADDAGNVSGASAAVSVVVADTVPPTDPQEVSALANGSSVTVGWTASTDNAGVAGYRVYRGTSSAFAPNAASKIADVATTSFTDSALTVGTYYYKVIAVDSSGLTSGAGASQAVVVSDTVAPTSPAPISATVSGAKIDLAWGASTDNVAVSGYSVYRGSSADFAPTTDNRLSTLTGTSWTDSTPPVGTTYYKVIASDAAGNLSAPAVTSATIADVTPPSQPSALTAVANGTSVQLTWTASTDDVAVVGYSIYRGANAGFAANESSKVADSATASYADSGLAAGTYYYVVAARDASANASALSDVATATVNSTATPPTVIAVPASADAMVAQSAANTNYGAANYLSTRNSGSTTLQTYFSFALPTAPAGTTLTGATIQLRTSTDSSSASADSHTFQLVDGTWTEAAITWTNRPTAVGATLGAFTGAAAINAPYSATLDAASLSSLSGTTISVLMTDAGPGDNLRLWSKESTTASYRPSLTLTYTAG